MNEPTNRQHLFVSLDHARQELMRSLLYLNESEVLTSAEEDGWCIRDIISHVTARECTVLAAAQHLAQEGDPHFPDPINEREFNRAAVRRRRDFLFNDVIDEMDGARRQVLRYTRVMHNQDLYAGFSVRSTGVSKSVADVLAELVEHDYHHAADIWQRRAALGLLHRLDFRLAISNERSRFMNALNGLFEQQMTTTEVCGYWTVREVMAHLLSWDEEILRTVEHWSDERPWQQDALYDDEWNETEVAARAEMTVDELAEGLLVNNRKLLHLFDTLGDQELATLGSAPWGERMALVSFLYEMAQHNATHRVDVQKLHGSSRNRKRRR